MSMEVNEIDWDYIMNEFASYEGTILSFCKKYNWIGYNYLYRKESDMV